MNNNNLLEYAAFISNICLINQMKQKMFNNTINYQNFINQANIPLFSPNYDSKNYYKYKTRKQRKKIPYRNKEFKNIVPIRKNFINENYINQEVNNIKNNYEKINFIKMNKRRKNSIETNNTNFKSSTDEEENENNQKKEIEEKSSKNNEDSNIILIPKEKKFDCENETKRDLKFDNKMNKEEYEGNPLFENTEILRVYVKISKDKKAVFKLKRYDDIFETIKLFCEINLVDEKLIKPLIMKSLSTMNTIYRVMNSKLDEQQIKILQNAKNI